MNKWASEIMREEGVIVPGELEGSLVKGGSHNEIRNKKSGVTCEEL